VTSRPYLSVVMPAHRALGVLPRVLDALFASDLPREEWELIVVDDASPDATPAFAARHADAVILLPGPPQGPAYARNRGAEAARGEVLVFVDSDVCVHRSTLRQFAELFRAHSDIGAAFGSYDDNPPAPGLVSQYRNLLHHYHHQQNAGDAETFWAGCGAIRRALFLKAGMYDEWHYPKPSIEDIELGHRLRALGARIVLRPEIQCTHLKQWTLRNMARTDLHDRGVPWMRLLLQEERIGTMQSLNLKRQEKINTALAGLGALALVVAPFVDWRLAWLTPLLGLPILITNLPLYRFFRRVRGLGFALAVLPLHYFYYLLNCASASLGFVLHHVIGEPHPRAEVQAFSEVGLANWPPVPSRGKWSPWSGARRAAGEGMR
jgi:cellulose synthase/poly-beta-1,6-N-acetylglucosamine synthase-like glycosyltransferase